MPTFKGVEKKNGTVYIPSTGRARDSGTGRSLRSKQSHEKFHLQTAKNMS